MLWIHIGFKVNPVTDPDPACYVNADPDSGSQTNADPMHIRVRPCKSLKVEFLRENRIDITKYPRSYKSLFERLEISFMGDTDPQSQWIRIRIQESEINADPDPHKTVMPSMSMLSCGR